MTLRTPFSAEQVTADWLTQSPRPTSILGNAAVESFEASAQPIGRGSRADHAFDDLLPIREGT